MTTKPRCCGLLEWNAKYNSNGYWYMTLSNNALPTRIEFCPFCGVDLGNEFSKLERQFLYGSGYDPK